MPARSATPYESSPYHPLLASQAEMGLATVPASMPTPPSAGYVP